VQLSLKNITKLLNNKLSTSSNENLFTFTRGNIEKINKSHNIYNKAGSVGNREKSDSHGKD